MKRIVDRRDDVVLAVARRHHAYAGADIEKVHDLPRDKEFLIEPEKTVSTTRL